MYPPAGLQAHFKVLAMRISFDNQAKAICKNLSTRFVWAPADRFDHVSAFRSSLRIPHMRATHTQAQYTCVCTSSCICVLYSIKHVCRYIHKSACTVHVFWCSFHWYRYFECSILALDGNQECTNLQPGSAVMLSVFLRMLTFHKYNGFKNAHE